MLGARALLLCMLAYWHGLLAQLNGTLIIHVSAVPAVMCQNIHFEKSLLCLQVLVMKNQLMLAGQSIVM